MPRASSKSCTASVGSTDYGFTSPRRSPRNARSAIPGGLYFSPTPQAVSPVLGVTPVSALQKLATMTRSKLVDFGDNRGKVAFDNYMLGEGSEEPTMDGVGKFLIQAESHRRSHLDHMQPPATSTCKYLHTICVSTLEHLKVSCLIYKHIMFCGYIFIAS